MAGNTKIGPIFRGANGGLSDDLFTGIKNSFYYSEGLEIREDDKSVYPKISFYGRRFELGTPSQTGAVKSSIKIGDDWYIFCENNVYKLDTVNDVGTPLASWIGNLAGESLKDAELFNGYVYISTNKSLYRISQSAADATWGSEANFTKMTLNTSYYHPLYATNEFLAVGNKDKLSIVSREVPDQVVDKLTLQGDYIVMFIDELGGFLRITAEDGGYGAEILLWDGAGKAPNEVIPMMGYRFLQSCVYNGYHYLLSDKGLGLMNGYQYYIMKKIDGIGGTWNLGSNRISNGMVVYDDKLLFVTAEGTYIYGAKNKNYTDVLNMWDGCGDNRRLGAIGTDGNTLVSSIRDYRQGLEKTNVYLYNDTTTQYSASGTLITRAYYGASMSEIKQAEYLRIGYKIENRIEVYYKTDAKDRTPLNTDLRTTSDMRSPFSTTLKLNCRFQWIQFKFILHGLDTHLYSADLYYNTMLE